MTVRTVFKLLMLAVLAAVIWQYAGRGGPAATADVSPEARRAALVEKIQREVSQGFAGSGVPAPAALAGPIAAPRAAVRKCLHRGAVLYTDERCPDGAREDTVRRGTLTVMPKPGAPSTGDAGLRVARRPEDAVLD